MSKLTDLRAAVTQRLGSVDATVLSYINALEAKVKLNGGWLAGVFVAGLVIGAFLGHAFTKHV